MILQVETREDIVVAKVELTTLDFHTTKEFRQETASLVANRCVVLDLEAINFIDSTGLGALLTLLRAVRLNGGELRLTGVGPKVLTIFRLVRMNNVFEIYSDSEEAISSFSSPDNRNDPAPQCPDETGHDRKGPGRSSEMIREL